MNFLKGLVLYLLFTTSIVFAQSTTSTGGSKRSKLKFQEQMILHNLEVLQSADQFSSVSPSGLFVKRPVAEYEKTGYLMFYDLGNFNSSDVKAKLVENLPAGVTAVIYTDQSDDTELEGLYTYYSRLAPDPSQVTIITIPNPLQMAVFENEFGLPFIEPILPNGFWSRDAIPVPVLQMTNLSPLQALSDKFTVVDARYYHYYEPDQLIADYYSSALLSHNYYFEGGNFMVSAKGDCLVINTEEVDIIPNSIFRKSYGCSNLIRLPYLKGIGHADESVKFVSDNHVLTDDNRYRKILENKGFKVTMLPRPKRDLETYVNSLIINGTVWVPVYQQDKSDQEAIDVYKKLGFQVVPVDSSLLSNVGAGSVHCITMTYPDTVTFNDLMAHFDSRRIVDSSSSSPGVQTKVRALELERSSNIENLKDPGLNDFLDSLYQVPESRNFNL